MRFYCVLCYWAAFALFGILWGTSVQAMPIPQEMDTLSFRESTHWGQWQFHGGEVALSIKPSHGPDPTHFNDFLEEIRATDKITEVELAHPDLVGHYDWIFDALKYSKDLKKITLDVRGTQGMTVQDVQALADFMSSVESPHFDLSDLRILGRMHPGAFPSLAEAMGKNKSVSVFTWQDTEESLDETAVFSMAKAIEHNINQGGQIRTLDWGSSHRQFSDAPFFQPIIDVMRYRNFFRLKLFHSLGSDKDWGYQTVKGKARFYSKSDDSTEESD